MAHLARSGQIYELIVNDIEQINYENTTFSAGFVFARCEKILIFILPTFGLRSSPAHSTYWSARVFSMSFQIVKSFYDKTSSWQECYECISTVYSET